MNLGVDGLRLLGPRSGVGRVLEALLRGLGEVEQPFEEVRVYTPVALDDTVGLPSNARNVVVPSRLAPGWWQQLTLPRAARLDAVLLCPSYVAPLRALCPTLLIHHGSYEGFPPAFPWFDRTRARILYASSAHRATTVTTVSESSRRDMAHFYRIDPAAVHVIPDGVDTRLFRRLGSSAPLAHWRERVLGADVPFLLHVGKPTRRRNLPSLIEAFALMKREDGIPHHLVLVGTDLAGSPVGAVIERFGLVGDVHTIGFFSHEELVLAYNAASLFVYPSSYEGFGMPVLEAMACGTPAVALDNSAFPEFCDGAALLLPDAGVNTLRRGITGLLDDHAQLRQLATKGPQRAAGYDWRLLLPRYVELLVGTAGG